MSLPAPGEKRAAVERMFDRIAPRYDAMNRLMTFGIDRGWRRQAIARLELRGGERVLDLGCGTGDLAAAVAGRGGRPLGLDPSGGMLDVARRRHPTLAWIRGEGERLPLADASLDAIVSGFALRNLADLAAAFAECARVLRRGGRLVLLEVDAPRGAWLGAGHRFYFRRMVPLLGRLFADRDAYAYLPDSVVYLPDERGLASLLETAGFAGVAKTSLLAGAAQLVVAHRLGAA